MNTSLRERIRRLAKEDAELRPDLLKILAGREDRKGSTVVHQSPIVIQQAPIVIQDGGGGVVPAAIPSMITSPVVAPPATVSPNQSPTGVPVPVPATAPAISNLFSTERTQNGFRVELQPELDRLHQAGLTKQQAAQNLLDVVNTAFTKKDMLYNILIRYQSSFEGDAEFLGSLTRLIETWASSNTGA